MIDSTKPFNELQKIPPDIDFDQIDILKLVNKANIALSRLDGQTSVAFHTFSNAMLLANTFSVREAVDSSSIENVVTTVKEALESRALSDSDLSPEQKETKGYAKAIQEGFKTIGDNGFLNTNDFISLQSKLNLPNPGIRKLPGYVIANQETKEIYYTPPEGERLIRNLLQDFENYFNYNDDDPDVLIKMAIMHYQFEAIHPFADGNGRTGRMLMALYLVITHRLTFPVLFLSDYILNHRSEYYTALRGVTYENKWNEWVKYILGAVIEQSEKTTQAISSISILKFNFEKDIPKSIPKARIFKLVDYVFTTAAFSREQFSVGVDIHPNTAARYLHALCKAGLIDSVRRKNKLIYFSPGFLDILKQ